MRAIMNTKKAFTLIELMVVIAILGILMSIVVFSIGGSKDKARLTAVTSALSQMKIESQLYISPLELNFPNNICDLLNSKFNSTLTPGISDRSCKIDNTTVTTMQTGIANASTTGTADSWAYWVTVNGSGDKYCSDSTGFTGKISQNLTDENCASGMMTSTNVGGPISPASPL
jgi:prepilin-type N-terminal cleavage/methylation domain-containing protein